MKLRVFNISVISRCILQDFLSENFLRNFLTTAVTKDWSFSLVAGLSFCFFGVRIFLASQEMKWQLSEFFSNI
jgi:hypothetical protein